MRSVLLLAHPLSTVSIYTCPSNHLARARRAVRNRPGHPVTKVFVGARCVEFPDAIVWCAILLNRSQSTGEAVILQRRLVRRGTAHAAAEATVWRKHLWALYGYSSLILVQYNFPCGREPEKRNNAAGACHPRGHPPNEVNRLLSRGSGP